MSKNSERQQLYESEVSDDWLDRLARFNQHFGRFVRDVLGVLLIAAAIIIFLALRGYTQGVLLTPWVSRLALWFGWGAYLVVIAFGYGGYALLRRSVTPLPWGRLFALEVAAFLTLGLLGNRCRWWAYRLGNGHVVLAIWTNSWDAFNTYSLASRVDERIQPVGIDRTWIDKTCG